METKITKSKNDYSLVYTKELRDSYIISLIRKYHIRCYPNILYDRKKITKENIINKRNELIYKKNNPCDRKKDRRLDPEYKKKYDIKSRPIYRLNYLKNRELLTDKYIKNLFISSNGFRHVKLKYTDITPELITLKRKELLTKQKIKNHDNK